jgi:hypothetical protein
MQGAVAVQESQSNMDEFNGSNQAATGNNELENIEHGLNRTQFYRQTLDIQIQPPKPQQDDSETEQDSSNSDPESVPQHPFYENVDLTTSGAYQHFTLPRPQVRNPSWTDTEDEYNNIGAGGSVTSSAELISESTSPSSSPLGSITDPGQVDADAMNNYPYHGSNGSIYHNLYSYSSSQTSSSRDDRPYASIKNNTRLKKIRSDNVSPAVSNTTASTGLSSSRGTARRQQKPGPGEYGPSGNGTVPRAVPTMSRRERAANAAALYYSPQASPQNHVVVPVPVQACQGNGFCSGCSGPMQLQAPVNHLETIPEMCSLKTDPTLYWNYNGNNHVHVPLKRNSSIGGFTLNGQPRLIKKSKMSRFCSSHKIALVVSTFSMFVTLGLVITLILMKKKGMMEAM